MKLLPLILVLSPAAASPPEPIVSPAAAASREKSGSGCIVDPAAVEDLRKRSAELQARGKDLAAKEMELRAREAALEERLRKLEETREAIGAVESGRAKESAEKIAKLVETVESMSPKVSAQLLSLVDEQLAIQAMAKITTARLAKILNVMEPARSARLSELLTGVARVSRKPTLASTGATAATTAPGRSESRKGGDRDDGSSHEQRAGAAVPAPGPGKEPGGGEPGPEKAEAVTH